MLSRNWSIYKNQVVNKFESPVHKDELNTDILKSLTVADIIKTQDQITTVNQNDNLSDLRKLWEEEESEIYPVIDENNNLIAILSMNQMRKVILETTTYNLVIVEDMMTELFTLELDSDLHSASQQFLISKYTELPVVDSNKNIVGLLKYQDIIQAYDELLKKE